MSNYLSKEAIRKLHLSGTGKKGIIYVDEDYSVYEGVENGRIRVLQRANSTLIKNSSANVDTVITNLQNQINATGIKWSDDFTVLADSTTISLSFLANKSILLIYTFN